MYNNRKIIVILPAYNAAKTLEMTYREIPHDIVDHVVLVDDCSNDDTLTVAKALGINHIIQHEGNLGYGANQKTCYNKALELGGDIIIMLHPDYQYTPKLIGAMVSLIANGVYPVVFGSRILGKGALRGGMPRYKYLFNRILTFIQNLFMNQKMSEYHTGYRAYSAEVLRNINYLKNSDGFIFDNEIVAQIFSKEYSIGEITCPARYDRLSSSIGFLSSLKYGAGVLRVSFLYALTKSGLIKWKLLK
jgi:glycosyltransferase involved in cell wall biosynthesis